MPYIIKTIHGNLESVSSDVCTIFFLLPQTDPNMLLLQKAKHLLKHAKKISTLSKLVGRAFSLVCLLREIEALRAMVKTTARLASFAYTALSKKKRQIPHKLYSDMSPHILLPLSFRASQQNLRNLAVAARAMVKTHFFAKKKCGPLSYLPGTIIQQHFLPPAMPASKPFLYFQCRSQLPELLSMPAVPESVILLFSPYKTIQVLF